MKILASILAISLNSSILTGADMQKSSFVCFEGYPKNQAHNIKPLDIKDTPPVWDLSYLYKGYQDPKIEKDLKNAIRSSLSFKKTYSEKTRDQSLDTSELLKAIQEYESISTKGYLPAYYISNLHNIDMNSPTLTAIYGKINLMTSELSKNMSFFENNISKSNDKYKEQLLRAKELKNYRNWLTKLFTKKIHLLPENVEEIIIEKDLNGVNSWRDFRRLYESKYSFLFKGPEDKKEREYTLTELVKFAEHEKRELRQRSVEAYLKKFNEDSYIFAHIYNSIIQDMLLIEKNRRGYYPLISSRNLESQLDDKVVDVMHKVISKNYGLAQRYWKLKAKMLGIKNFNNADIRAPYTIKDKDTKRYTYKEAMKMLQETYDTFYEPYGKVFENMYRCGLVDAKPKPGKRGGAYCSSFPNGYPPIVLLNYLGTLEDISTAAHEGGHWIHGLLISEKQSLVNSEIPMATAETASIFNEILLTTKLLKEKSSDKEAMKSLLLTKLDGIMATIFRQTAFSFFEQEAFKSSEKGPLSPDEFSDIFVKTYGALLGDAVETMPDFKYEWARIPHFMRPFYVYAYAFGELATISLYQKYLDDPKNFPEKYMDFLASGSSLKPKDLFMKVDINIADEKTWNDGMKYISGLIDKLEELSK
jgi:oligoendopeptidase F